MKKPNPTLTTTLLPLLLLIAALWWGGCNYFEEDPYADDPCRSEIWDEPKGNTYVELHPEIRDAVPYDTTMKTQRFVYCDSNGFCDTTTLFLEYDSLELEIGFNGASPCDTVFVEMHSFSYTNQVPRILISTTGSNSVKSYERSISQFGISIHFYDENSIYPVYQPGRIYNLKQVRNFKQNLIDTTINGKDFIQVKPLMDDNGELAALYNLTEGVLYMQNNSSNALIKYAYKTQ